MNGRAPSWIACAAALVALGCGSDEPEPTPTPSEETIVDVFREPVLTEAAVLPEQDAHVVNVEVREDALVLTYDGPGADVPGEGAVLAGVEAGGYLRRVLSVNALSDVRFELATEHAQLVDLFEDVHFRVRHEPGATSWVERGPVGGRRDALGGTFNLLDDLPISETCGIAPGQNVEVKAELSPIFDAEFDIFRRTQRRVRVELGGSIKVSVEAQSGAGIGLNCEFEVPAERMPSREFANVFFIGWIPVAITHTIQTEAKLEVGATVSAGEVTGSADATYRFSVGASYEQGMGWSPIGTADRTSTANLELTEQATASVTAKVTPGVSYTLKIYDTAGPKIALRPSVEGELESTLCEWEGEVKGALTAAIAPKLDVPVFDVSLLEVDFNLELLSGTFWTGEGTWAWCADGGVDAGMPGDGGVSGDAGMPGDGGADPCATHSTCEDCNDAEGCGFCRSSGQCMSDGRRAECGSGWLDEPSSCPDCSGFTDCASCAANGFCGWCPGMGCLNDSTEEARMCADYQPIACGG
ncbi:MAG TPA: hypothetical protein RMH85_29295 [Polyangiaceae bacterium LLY-WYZ-15_(1-7)]|nr:hypothetical protein [Myxococcales bacterium]MAT27120.1 hypothetical protein [Sandaracinus sp.]HJL06804.1 hypothetical protein [Polyangiaceae bacterium LLY-WYZ-15_(1-7)]HJL12612.1 hypothetical protein [Polyangiaceae bacterium LLY-WYZ-15_(1-7)]HJL28639.1 hypothetical protein [Polyangiaceae bacterium LLY-WYZ-15_(1-7)]